MSEDSGSIFDFDAAEGPIDVVQSLAEHNAWTFDRLDEDQIAMEIAGQWHTYTITLACAHHESTLRLVCAFDVSPSQETLPAFYETLNLINNQCWFGSFVYWEEPQMVIWRSAVDLPEYTCLDSRQVEIMLGRTIASCDRFYPCLQLILWGRYTPEEAMQVGISEAYGRA